MAGSRAERLAKNGLKRVRDIAYAYTDADGVKVAKKLRYKLVDIETGEVPTDGRDTKDFAFQHKPDPEHAPHGWDWGIGPYGDWLMYRLPPLLAALRAGKDVYWCEGEKDARNAYKAYGVCATSHHQGAAPIKPGQAKWFAGTDSTIHIVMDRDDSGQQIAWDHAVALRKVAGLSWGQMRFLLPAVQEKKADLSDHIHAGYGPDDLCEMSPEELGARIEQIGPLPRKGRKAGPNGSGGSN